jgi:hypothetical protein
MDLQQVAKGLRALVGQTGTADFQPRLESLVKQVERLAAQPSLAQQTSASSSARAERLAAKTPAPATGPAVAPVKPPLKKPAAKKKATPKATQLA